jgi:hypothetical protein
LRAEEAFFAAGLRAVVFLATDLRADVVLRADEVRAELLVAFFFAIAI